MKSARYFQSRANTKVQSISKSSSHPRGIFLIYLSVLLGLGTLISCSKSMDEMKMAALPTLIQHNGDDFVVIAHRGASGYAPENTMPAFKKALELGSEMIEFDVMLSKDGVPVLFHDAQLDKKSNGSGPLSEKTLDELRGLDVGSWFSKDFEGSQMPTLEEVLEWGKGTMTMNIEIKTEAWREDLTESVEPKVIELVRKAGVEDQIIFSSFDYRILRRLKELAPDLRAAVLYEPSQSGDLDPVSLVRELGVDGFNCSWRQLTPEWMESLSNSGIPVLIYTVNEQEKMDELVQLGVTGIFSDYPDVLTSVAKRVKKGD